MTAARELMMLDRLLVVSGVELEMLSIGVNLCLLVLRPRSRGYGATKESHNERTRNTLKQFTYSLKLWEPLKGSIFGVISFIPALMGPGGSLVVVSAGPSV